jgi:predicted nucleic acid-binding protein
MKAREFRDRFLKQPKKTLATPDAIHLATAAIYKADEFWTLDRIIYDSN